jgi:NAD-specific glutamate dehydrogenase
MEPGGKSGMKENSWKSQPRRAQILQWASWPTDFLGSELLLLALVLDLDDGLVASLGLDSERPVLHVGLNLCVGELATNETFGIEDGVVGVLQLVVISTLHLKLNRCCRLRLTMATWFFAASPMSRSESLKATYDGVVRLPWSLTKGVGDVNRPSSLQEILESCHRC